MAQSGLLVVIFFISSLAKAELKDSTFIFTGEVEILYHNTIFPSDDSLNGKSNSNENKKNKFILSILSFPLPFGILGLHRVYLGTKPYVPFFYIGTLGGCLGILPLIDFICIIASGKDKLEQFENCPGVFMWSH